MVLQTWHRGWLSWRRGGSSHSSPYTAAGSASGSKGAWPTFRFSLPWEETPAAGWKPGFPLARQVLCPPEDSSQGTTDLCNRPVKPHCLFAHHTTQKSERDVETLSAAVGCNPTVWELPVWATNVEVGISTGTAFISLGYTWKTQLRLSCSTKNPAQVGRI